jgi:putative ABC transport system permease protein
MLRLALANIAFRKMRSAISIVAVAVGIALLLVLVGMTQGTLREVAQRMQGTGADLLVHPQDMNPVLDTFASLPVAAVERIRGVKGVAAVCPVVVWGVSLHSKYQRIFGVDPEEFRGVGASLRLVQGRLWREPNEIIVDERLAQGLGYKIGDTIQRLGRRLTIVGICEAANGARILMPIKTLQEARSEEGKVSFVLVKCAKGEPEAAVAGRIESELSSLDLRTVFLREYSKELSRSFRGLHEFIAGVSTVCLIISFLTILLTLYTTVVERTREIAILKALGASRSYIMGNILGESVILCLLGVVAGVAMTWVTKGIMCVILPLLTVEITFGWLLVAGLLGTLGGLLGAVYPALRAAAYDPAVALSYE